VGELGAAAEEFGVYRFGLASDRGASGHGVLRGRRELRVWRYVAPPPPTFTFR
jgi:hypothetical protein